MRSFAHEQTELALHFIAPFPWNKTKHTRITRCRVQQSGEHFEHSRLAGAIGAEETDKLAFLDLKRDLVCRSGLVVAPPEQPFDRTPEAALLAVSAIDLSKFRSFNHWHRPLKKLRGDAA